MKPNVLGIASLSTNKLSLRERADLDPIGNVIATRNPSWSEIAAFEDLTTKQKAAYLKAHPKSKFGANAPKVTQHVKEQRAIKGHLGKAAKSMKLAHAHMALHKDALAKGDSKLADHHEKNMHKHADDADQHYSRAQDTTAEHSPKNKARSAKLEKGFDAIKKHSIATKAPKRAGEKDKAANAKKRPFNGFKDVVAKKPAAGKKSPVSEGTAKTSDATWEKHADVLHKLSKTADASNTKRMSARQASKNGDHTKDAAWDKHESDTLGHLDTFNKLLEKHKALKAKTASTHHPKGATAKKIADAEKRMDDLGI